jgi:hypothetical protein
MVTPRRKRGPAGLASGALTVTIALGAACGGTSPDLGLMGWLRVAGGMYFPGSVEAVATNPDAPPVVSVFNSLTTVQPGERDKPVSGALASAATAVSLGLRGDRGYFVVVAGPPALDAPDQPTFAVTLSFSTDLPPGPQTLVVRAIDASGNFGAPMAVPLVSVAAGTPAGTLVITLRWDTESDLDLHVVVPGGVEVWAGNISSYQTAPPGTPVDPLAWQRGGILDFDSNAGCMIDGRRQEAVVWQAPPPPGTYIVRVDAASLCGTPAARWTITSTLNDISAGASEGEALPSDVRFSKGAGSGVQALVFDVPES